jgi:hypothetical protein
MKTQQEMTSAFDRLSTPEELHQVLDLLGERGHLWTTEVTGAAGGSKIEVLDMWEDPAGDEEDKQYDAFEEIVPWADPLVCKTEPIN